MLSLTKSYDNFAKTGNVCEFWDFYTCEFCPYLSRTAFMMCKHLNLHTIKPATPTFICDSNTPAKYEYEIRELVETVEKTPRLMCIFSNIIEKYKCKMCEFKTNLKLTLKYHIRFAHEEKEATSNLPVPGISKCYQCGFKTYSMLVLLNHVYNDCKSKEKEWYEYRLSISRRFLECKDCSYETASMCNMKRHRITKHETEKNVKWLKCEQCSYKSRLGWDLKRHVFAKHKYLQEMIRYKCTQCSFKTKHKKECDMSWFKCEQCSYKTRRECDLKDHVLSIHKNKNPQEINWNKCGECPCRTKHDCNMKGHITAVHGNTDDKIGLFKCEQCSVETKRTLHLDPNGLSERKCEQCLFKTVIRGRFKTHIQYRNDDAQDKNNGSIINLNTNKMI